MTEKDPSLQPSGNPYEAGAYSRRFFLGATGVIGLAELAGCSSSIDGAPTPAPTPAPEQHNDDPAFPAELDKTKEQDLLHHGNWQFMPGTSAEEGGLRVKHTGLAILTNGKDGVPAAHPEYIPNAPVNLYGSRLIMKEPGNVGVQARLSDVQGSTTLSFMDTPPIRQDENLRRNAGVDVTVNAATATVKVWDNKGEVAGQQNIVLPDVAKTADIVVMQDDKGLFVRVNGQEAHLDRTPLDKQIWFGVDTADTCKIDVLSAYPAHDNEISTIDSSKDFPGKKTTDKGLWGIANQMGRGDKLIGTAADLGDLVANPEYANFIIENFNELETEHLAKFQALQPEEGKWNFAELDAFVQLCNDHGKEVHGHTLIFTEAYPQWLSDKLNDPNFTKEQAIQLMTDYIKTVVGRYNGDSGKGVINAWDVVNEVFSPDEWSELNKQSLWYQKIGPEYIEIAFKAAREANSHAKLYMNDWGETDEDRTNAMISTATALKKKGIPIDGVGFQCHIDEETLDDEDAMNALFDGGLVELFSRLADAGLLARVSEASVANNGNDEMQAMVYETLTRAAMVAKNCTGINFWGFVNSKFRNSYFTGNTLDDTGDDAPMVQDANGKLDSRPGVLDGIAHGLMAA